ncbi:hypothetical protein INT47_000745 [Mucor saturninus]|uniref:TauD/TfdA-like domain-containing protein n=1 Tax=Mucor saturninus TaxID=64648 RepID=A0A8H7QUC8_9FUNG|nr:hypothetical protein INT47_000745 [Mucor saturninus]
MSPPNQNEQVIPVQEQVDIKQLAEAGYYLEFPKTTYPELTAFKHEDVGHRADPKKSSLYENATKVFNLTPNIGTEIEGLQLSKLTNQQKDDLALLIAERGVVFFRDQDINPHQGLELGSHYGPLHVHNVAGHPPNLPEILPVYYGKDIPSTPYERSFTTNLRASDGWHSDVSYELQPPGFTFLKIDTLPGEAGGDTLWSSGYAAYDRLSPEIKKTLEGLEAVHSGKEQADGAVANGRTSRRKDNTHTHPIVRTHPVTGWKSLYVQPGFTRSIVGLSKHESNTLLQFLYDHITGGYDFQVRFRWTENAVAVWDNRVTSHAAIFDYLDDGKRHGWRVTTQAERPYYDPKSKSRKEELQQKKTGAEQKKA